MLFSTAEVFAQTYSQQSTQLCSAYYYREYTFTGTPETPVDATLSVNWLYCGPNYNGSNFGRLDFQIYVGGNWEYIANNLQDNNHGCSWVVDNFTIPAATINAAINTAPGGSILVRADISDGCTSGYGCNSYSDPCFRATLTYDYAPSADFSADITSSCVGGEVIFTNETTGPQDTYSWDFGTDAVPQTATGVGPHAVSWTSSGDKDVALTVVGNSETSVETKTAYVNVASVPSPIIIGNAYESWQNRSNGNTIQVQQSIMDDNDNTYQSGVLNGSGTDVWVEKIDASGNTVWFETFTNSGNESITDMTVDAGGNVFLCGSSAGDYLIMKVNNDGTLGWLETYNAGSTDQANAICIDNSGAVYVTGVNGNDVTTAKFDAAGTYSFHVTETDAGNSEGTDIVCKDGYIYVFGTINTSGLNEDWLLVKYETALGLQQWIQNINGTGFGNDNGYQMVLDGTDLYLFGKSDQASGFGWSVAKYDLDGNEAWMEDYFTGSTGFGTYDAMAVGTADHLYLGSSMNTGGDDFARVLKLAKSDGSQVWYSDFSAINDTYFRGVSAASDGTVYLAGVTENNAGNDDLCIEQIDDTGSQMWWAVYDGCGSNDDDAIGVMVKSSDEVIITGHNNQVMSIQFGPLISATADFMSNEPGGCISETITFTDASVGSNLTYTWNFGADATPQSATGPGPHDVTFGTSGTKTVNLEVENSLGTDDVDYTVDVYAAPSVSTSGNVDICIGNSTILEAFGSGTFEWDNGLGTGSSVTVSPAIETDYEVTITDGNGCTNSASLTVSVNELPTVNAGNDATICAGESVALSGSGSGTLEWSNGLGSTPDPAVSPNTETTYTLTVTDGNQCENQDDVTVFVNDQPEVDAGDDEEICVGESVTISATGGISYSWDNALGSGQSHSVSPSQNTTYVVTAIDANQCENTDQVLVTVNQLPLVSATGTSTICEGESTLLEADGAETYVWDNMAGMGALVSVSPTETTVYTVTGTDANQCENTSQVAITVNEAPEVLASQDVSVCQGESTTISASGAFSYLWNNGAGSLNFAEVSPTFTTTYTVIGTSVNNCQATDDVTVTVNALPEPTVTQNGTELSTGSYQSYQWYLDGDIIPGATAQTYTPLVNGTYTVEVEDANECVGASDQFSVLTVSVDELSNGEFVCYPNPVTDVVFVESLNNQTLRSAKVLSLLGDIVLLKTINAAKAELDLSSFADGIYLIEVELPEGLRKFRIAKQ